MLRGTLLKTLRETAGHRWACVVVISAILLVPAVCTSCIHFHAKATRDTADKYLGNDLFSSISAVEAVRLESGAWVAFVLDPTWCRVLAINEDTKRITAFGKWGSENQDFEYPEGLAADSHGNVIISDTNNNRIVKLRYDNRGFHFVRSFGKEAGLKEPRGLELTGDRIYVADTGNSRIVRFSLDGDFVTCSEPPTDWGPFSPVDVACGHGTLGGTIYVSDLKKCRVIALSDQYDYTSQPIRYLKDVLMLKLDPHSCGFCLPIDVDGYGQLYVADETGCSIVKLDPDTGQVLCTYGTKGFGPGQFYYPRAISVFPYWNRILVAEEWTNRCGLQELRADLEIEDVSASPDIFNPYQKDTTLVKFFLTDAARGIRIAVVSSSGDTVRTLMVDQTLSGGSNSRVWDGKDNAGTIVPDGVYSICVSGHDVYGAPYGDSNPTVPCCCSVEITGSGSKPGGD